MPPCGFTAGSFGKFFTQTRALTKAPEEKGQTPQLLSRFSAVFIEINVLETAEVENGTKAITFA